MNSLRQSRTWQYASHASSDRVEPARARSSLPLAVSAVEGGRPRSLLYNQAIRAVSSLWGRAATRWARDRACSKTNGLFSKKSAWGATVDDVRVSTRAVESGASNKGANGMGV